MEELNIKNKSQLSCTMFPEKYGSMALYDKDLKKRFIIDQEKINFGKSAGWNLIGISEQLYGSLSDHEYFSFMVIYLIEFNQLIRMIIYC